jgi:hypothetical protein
MDERDFDGFDDPQVKKDAAELIRRLDGTVLAVATGRGFHIHQIFDKFVTGDRWPTELVRYEREMAKDLERLDCVGTVDRLCRIPNTINPKRKRWCVVIDAQAFAADPLGYQIPKLPNASLDSLNPFLKHESEFSLIKWVHDNPPVQISREFETEIGEVESNDAIPIMPCLGSIYRDNPQNHVRVALGQHLCETLRNFADPRSMTSEQKKLVMDGAVGFIEKLGWRDYRENVTRLHLSSIVEMQGTPSCRWFVGKGMCPGKCWRYDGTVAI